MRPKLILLLALATATVTFMGFLISESKPQKMVCTEKNCCKELPPGSESSGGGEDNPNGTINHLIVSTLK
ncbi:MAG: hypothetical protein ABI581_02350 [Sediminibacterium sp.]